MQQVNVLGEVVERLEREGIEYMLVGSVAASYYSVPRFTRDIDLVVSIERGAVRQVVDLFRDQYYIDEGAVCEAVLRQSSFNVIHQDASAKVDIMILKGTDFHGTEFDRRRRVTMEGLSVSIVSPEDLILSKLDWARESHFELQLGDVRNLLRVVEGIDLDYVEAWAAKLGLQEQLLEVRS